MFTSPKQVLRVQYKTHIFSDEVVQIDVASIVSEKRITIKNQVMSQKDCQMGVVDLTIQQSQLDINEEVEGELISDVELTAMGKQIGIRSVTFLLENARELGQVLILAFF